MSRAYSLQVVVDPKWPHFPARFLPQLVVAAQKVLCRATRLGDNPSLPRGPTLTCHGSDGTDKGGPPMSGTQQRPFLASYRDAVAAQLKAGAPFGDVEDSIDAVDELSMDEKAALWLWAFSLRDPTEQQLEARTHLAALQ